MDDPILGLDIGGTKLAAGVVGPDGGLQSSATVPTQANDGLDAVLERLLGLGRTVLTKAGLNTPAAIGIGCGGPLDRVSGTLYGPPLLPGWDRVPITAIVSGALGAAAYLDNDGSAAALAEHRYGAGRGSSTMLYLTISTGIGGGAILANEPYRGASGNGCEFGHIGVVLDGRLCNCGRHGCLEAYASGSSIAARAQEALESSAPSILRERGRLVSAAEVAAAAASGDPLAQGIWTETTRLLGNALVDLSNAFEPERIVLGGGVTKSGRLLLDPCTEIVARDARSEVLIALSALGESVGIVGAAAVALDRLVTRG